MHGRIGLYTGEPAKIDAILDNAKAELPPLMRQQPGMRRYNVFRTAPGELISLSAWDSHDHAEAAGQKLVAWVKQNTGDAITGVENHVGEIAFSEPAGGASAPHVRVALYQFKPDTVAGAIAKAREGFLPILQRQPGFVRYTVGDLGGGRVVTISGWETRDEADTAVATAAGWVRENLARDVTSVQNHVGDLLWSAD